MKKETHEINSCEICPFKDVLDYFCNYYKKYLSNTSCKVKKIVIYLEDEK